MGIKIVDSVMGSGKTTAAIRFINDSPEDVKFLYITPFLSEVDRVMGGCSCKRFVQPNEAGGKLRNIKSLFEKGRNIVSTHALFQRFTREVLEIIKSQNYILIMDEVADVVQPLSISEDDLNTLLEKYATIDQNGLLRWKDYSYTGLFDNYKRMCALGSVGVYSGTALLWLLPIEAFDAFADIYIMTYMFSAQIQRYYYDYYGMKYSYVYVCGDGVDTYRFSSTKGECKIPDYKNLIHIVDKDKLNEIGDEYYSLSSSWYLKGGNKTNLERLKGNTQNFFRNIVKASSKKVLWTTFETYEKRLAGKGYSKGFLACNARATNDFRDRTAVAYLVNRFFNPVVKNFFIANGVEVEESRYALSEMLQWIWRSAIRDGKEIWLYVPSSRMRNLLVEWLESEVK